MELIQSAVSVCETAARGSTRAMADGDIIVPDVKPDILKILQVDADARVTDKYVENGRLTVSGRVDCKILYIPDKEGVRIKSILAAMDFRQTADAGGADDSAEIIAAAAVERVEFNAVNSRKLRLRAVIEIDYEVCQITEAEICTGVSDETAEKKPLRVSFENTVDISEHDFTLKEALEVPAGQTSIAEILKADVRISDTEYKTVTGKIIVKGSAGVCVLYSDDEGEVKYIEAELPFTEVFDADGVGEDTICDIDYCAAGILCEARPDSDGDMRIAELDIDLRASVRGTETEEISALCDCFVPGLETDITTEKLTLCETSERPSVRNTLREVIDFPANLPKVSGVYNVMTNAVVTKAELQRNRILCEGRLEAYILYLTDSGENPVYSHKKDIPFSYMLDCENASGGERVDIKASVRHVSYNLNSAGGLELRCLLGIEGRLRRFVEIDNITGITTRERGGDGGIIVYFTRPGDTLWDIAKRCAVPAALIEKHNKLEGGALGDKLIIPAA